MTPQENLGLGTALTVAVGVVMLCAGLSPIAFLVVAALIGAFMGALVVKDI